MVEDEEEEEDAEEEAAVEAVAEEEDEAEEDAEGAATGTRAGGAVGAVREGASFAGDPPLGPSCASDSRLQPASQPASPSVSQPASQPAHQSVSQPYATTPRRELVAVKVNRCQRPRESEPNSILETYSQASRKLPSNTVLLFSVVLFSDFVCCRCFGVRVDSARSVALPIRTEAQFSLSSVEPRHELKAGPRPAAALAASAA